MTLAPRSTSPLIERDRRRLAHVVGVRLEGEAEDADPLARDVAAERLFDALDHRALRSSLTSTVVATIRCSTPAASAVCSSASVSLGKQLPP